MLILVHLTSTVHLAGIPISWRNLEAQVWLLFAEMVQIGTAEGGRLTRCIFISPGGATAALPQPEHGDHGTPELETQSPRHGAGSQPLCLKGRHEEAGDDQVPAHSPDAAPIQTQEQPGHVDNHGETG